MGTNDTRRRVFANEGQVVYGNVLEAFADSLCQVVEIAEGSDGWRDISIFDGKPGSAAALATWKLRIEVEQLRARCNGVEARLRTVREELAATKAAVASALDGHASLTKQLNDEKRARQSDLACAEAERARLASQIGDYPKLLKHNRELLEAIEAKDKALKVALESEVALAKKLSDHTRVLEENAKLIQMLRGLRGGGTLHVTYPAGDEARAKVAHYVAQVVERGGVPAVPDGIRIAKVGDDVPWWASKDVDLTENALLVTELVSGNEKIVEACADKTAPIESLPVEHPSHAAHEAVKALKIRYNRALEAKSDLAWACGMAICVCEGRDGWQNVAEPDERAGTSAIRAAKVLRMKLDEIRKERDELKERLSHVGSSRQSFEVDVKVSPETEARLRHEFVSKLAGELHVVRVRNGGWTSPDESLREAEAIWKDSKQKPKPKVEADPIKLGDVVIMDPVFPVRTVSVPMTVEKIEGNQVSTFWFVGPNRHVGVFFNFQLVKANT